MIELNDNDKEWFAGATPSQQTDVNNAFQRSEYLARCCQQHQGLVKLLAKGEATPQESVSAHQQTLSAQLASCESEHQLMAILRQYHSQQMAIITWFDVLNHQTIEASLLQVSGLADALILAAYDWLYENLAKRYGYPQDKQPMCIVGMGKLGGKELNFSSDIDLIFAYPAKGETQGGRKPVEHQMFFTKLAQKLIHALDAVTADGRVYRVDMRLRPFGESGPLVAHFDALEDYYHEQAREWERFALMKGRILNPDSAATDALQAILHPFVYKRYLDFTTLDALRDIKQKINAETRRRRLDNNIKLGRGGIREAEFFVQSFQMIHGGRAPVLQALNWAESCALLADNKHLTNDDANALTKAYFTLRKVEHALQQLRNEQTQTLPENEADWQAIAASSDQPDVAKFTASIVSAREIIHGFFDAIFSHSDEPNESPSPQAQLCVDLWQLELNESEMLESCTEHMDSALAHDLAKAVFAFKQDLPKSRVAQRGMRQLDKLIPLLLEGFLNADHYPITVLERVFSLIFAVLGRTTYLDLLLENPDVRQQLFLLCAKSPWIAEQLRKFPLLLDELIAPIYLHNQTTDIEKSRTEYAGELRQSLLRIDPDDVEQHMETLRQFKLCQQLRIAAADLLGTLPVEKVSDKLTVLAEVILSHVITSALDQMTQRYGAPDNLSTDARDHYSGFAAIAYGKMGGWELGYGSDLDLVFIHNAPPSAQTQGAKSISAQQFYIKVSQRIMHLLNTKTLSGELYETDLRLRPAGNAGLLCCHIDGFEHYQFNEAWTWEHQALVRARSVFGDAQLTEQFATIRQQILSQQRPSEQLQTDVAEMRTKLFTHWQQEQGKHALKHGTGGITDIEFLAQYWVLRFAHQHPELMTWQDNLRVIDTAVKAGLLATEQGEQLQEAYLVMRSALHHQVLQGDHYQQQNQTQEGANKDFINEDDIARVRDQVVTIWQTILPPYTHS